MKSLQPVDRVAALRPYSVPPPAAPCDLWLAGNEGLPVAPDAWARLAEADPEIVRRYPKVAALESRLAQRHGVHADQVLVTSGADDALDRTCRAVLGPERGLVLPLPTFEMLHVYAKLANAPIATVPWAQRGVPDHAGVGGHDGEHGGGGHGVPQQPDGSCCDGGRSGRGGGEGAARAARPRVRGVRRG